MLRLASIVVLLAACGGGSSSKPAPTPPEQEAVQQEAPPPEDVPVERAEDPPPPEIPTTFEPTGAVECDALVVDIMCMYRKTPGVPYEAIKAMLDSIDAWRDALANDATRQATIDACKMSLDGGHDGFVALDCW